MANRKQELDAAVAESKRAAAEAAKPIAPAKPKQPTSRTAEFQLPWSKREEEGSKAPVTTNKGVENILVKQEVKQAWQKRKATAEAERTEAVAGAKERAVKFKQQLDKDPVVQQKAKEAADKFLGKKKAKVGNLRFNKGIQGSRIIPGKKGKK